MEAWDTIIAFGIIAAAAFYVIRKFARARKSGGGCGYGSGESCSGGAGDSSHCDEHHH